jgi:hypothetical protein
MLNTLKAAVVMIWRFGTNILLKVLNGWHEIINYRLLDSSVETKTNANMEIFADSILAQIRHLNVIIDTVKQTLIEKHIAIAITVVEILDNTPGQMSPERLLLIAEPLDIIELSIADSNGIITGSSVPKYIGFDYELYETTKEYMNLTNGTLTELSEEPRVSVFENDVGDINHLQHGSDYIKVADKGLFESKKNGRNRYTYMENMIDKVG